jgi:hypothetical protein
MGSFIKKNAYFGREIRLFNYEDEEGPHRSHEKLVTMTFDWDRNAPGNYLKIEKWQGVSAS